MRKTKLQFLVLISAFLLTSFSFAQTIDCDLIYWVDNSKIYSFDPKTETYKFTGFKSPDGASGIGIGRDIIGNTDKLVFWCTVNEVIHYYDGTKWVNTHHYGNSVNLGGGGDYWYILDGVDSKVYRYDGKSDAKMIIDFPEYAGPYDVVCDTKGNFYLILTKAGRMVQYSPQGRPMKAYRVEGLGGQPSGGGFGWKEGKIYGSFSDGGMVGTLQGNVIRFVPTRKVPESVDDFASCPIESFEKLPVRDTVETDTVQVVQTVDTIPVNNDVKFEENNIPVTIKDRQVKLQTTVTVKSTEFEIEVWDKSVVDGDSISLNLNGTWILENYAVVKTKYRLKVKINPTATNNYLILYALNLGEISPNTAAVSVLVDGQEYKLTLSSDLATSGALNFLYDPD